MNFSGFYKSKVCMYLFKTKTPWNVIYCQFFFLKVFENRTSKLLRFLWNSHLRCSIKNVLLKADSRLGWPNNFECFRVDFSLKRKTIQFSLWFNLYFQQKRAPRLSICHLPTKRSVWVFDVTNRTNGFSNFQSYHEVVMYLFNSLAKSCTLYWKLS